MPGRLLSLEVKNFRSRKSVSIGPLGPVSVLVGPNASGKSNLLDVIQFLGDSVRLDLGRALERHGGWERVRFRDGGNDAIVIRVSAAITRYAHEGAPDEYALTFRRLQKDLAGRVHVRRDPLYLVKKSADAGRRTEADRVADVVMAEMPVCAVVVHEDCDDLEPAHVPLARKKKEALDAAIGDPSCTVVPATPAWEIEAWWFLWPEAVRGPIHESDAPRGLPRCVEPREGVVAGYASPEQGGSIPAPPCASPSCSITRACDAATPRACTRAAGCSRASR